MKNMIICIGLLLILTGCGKNTELNDKTTSTDITFNTEVIRTTDCVDSSNEKFEDTPYVKMENVSVKKFMDFYVISEEQIPVEYIEAFIDEYDITEEQLGIGNIKELLMHSYQSGKVFGHNVNRIFDGPESEESLEKYIEKMEVLHIRFDRYYGEYSSREHMVIDLKEKKIYYSELDVQDYTSYDMSADLSDEDVESIREELPKHIDESIGYSKPEVYGEYSFGIFMNATDDTTKAYYGDIGEPEAFPDFDEYWRGLYKKYFGEEYKFESYYYNLYN